MAPATVNRELTLLKGIFSKAILWGKLHRINPVKQVKCFREDNFRLRYLSKDEIARLYEHCDEELYDLVKLALNTGMRRGEILNLTWKDIDIQKRLIYITDSKSGKGRVVPINDAVREVLINRKRHYAVSHIFLKFYRDRFEGVLKRAKIEDACFHTLRHTFASWLAMSGIDLLTVSRLLGHSDIKMTMRYAHLSPDYMTSAVQRLVTIWSQTPVLGTSHEAPNSHKPFQNQPLAEVAELADAQDLKS